MAGKNEIVIRPVAKWYLIDFAQLWQFRELLYIFTWRDIKVRYKQTAVGVLWVLLQPFVNTVIFTVFFGNFAKIPSQNLPYPVFVLLGLIYWGFFSNGLAHSANAFIENDALVKKVYFPRELLVVSSIVTAGFDFLVSLGFLAIVLVIYRTSINPVFLIMMIIGALITAVASLGLGLLLASINIKYRDVRYVLPFFLQLMIFITPVIYPLSIIRPAYQNMLLLNPMAGVINGLRVTLISGAIQDLSILVLPIFAAFLLLIIGLVYFRKTVAFFADIL